MDSDNAKDRAPILIIVICAGFSMIVDTISSSIKIMGYDEVIQADAKARAAKILQVKPNKELELKVIEQQGIINQLDERLKEVENLSHKPTG